jgi:hypothetical protein
VSTSVLAAALSAAVRRLAADGGRVPDPAAGTGAPFAEAIAWHRSREPLTDEEWSKRQDWYRRRSFTVANVAQLDLVSDVHRAIDTAIAEGTTLADFKKEVGDKLKAAWGGDVKNPAWRLEVIFRQGTLSAYGAGRYYQASSPEVLKRRPYWGLEVVVDSRTTKEICRPLVGTVLAANDPWWRVHIPPLHMLCRTALTTYTEEQAKKRGITAKPTLKPVQDGFGLAPDAIESDGPTASRWYEEKLKRAPAKLAEVAKAKQAAAESGGSGGGRGGRSGDGGGDGPGKPGDHQIAWLPKELAEAVGAKEGPVWLSLETKIKNQKHHPDVPEVAWTAVQQMIDGADLITTDKPKHLAVLHSADRWYLVVKALPDKPNHFAVSLRRPKRNEAERMRKRGRVIREK